MDGIRSLARWLKIDKWLKDHRWYFIGAGIFVALMVAWRLGGSFYRGVFGLAVLTALGFTARFVRWLVPRIKATTDQGVPVNVWRMWKEFLAERAKFADADERWALAMRAQKVIYDGQSPNLNRKTLTSTGDVRASINLAGIGGNLDTINRLAADGTLAGIMHCKEVSVQPTSRLGKATITFYNSPPLQRTFTVADLPASGKGRISFGIDETGKVAAVEYGLSMLIAGITGAGKSVLFWDMFADLLRDDQPTEMWFIDPKRTEFNRFKALVGHRVGNIRVMGYCTTAQEAAPLFEQFAADMHTRQDLMAERGITKLTVASDEFPARIIVMDEMLDIASAFPKGSALHISISQGRAALTSVIGLTQMAKIETIGSVRDLFPLRACLRTATPENTKAVLTLGENDGVPCSRIPRSMPGVGYYVTEEGIPTKFRAANVTEKQRDQLVAGRLPGMPVNVENIGPECFGYIAPERKSNRVGYVGIAGGLAVERHPVARRRAQHRKYDRVWCVEHQRVENFWRIHIDDTRMTVYKFPSRSAALVWEERTIRELRPKWNIQHNSGNPLSNFNLARRAGYRQRTRDAAGEYREWWREHRVARRAELAEAHAERVARRQAERDQFVQTVTGQ